MATTGNRGETQNNVSLLESTVRREWQRLFDFIRRRVRTDEDAEDLLQDVFYRLVTSYSVTEPIEKLTAWLFTVARNRITDWYRKRRPGALGGMNANDVLLDLEDSLFDPDNNPDDLYQRSLVWIELEDALDELPNAQRDVFVKHELEGKSFKEIAEETGESMSTLLSRKRYAILQLREHLQELYNDTQSF